MIVSDLTDVGVMPPAVSAEGAVTQRSRPVFGLDQAGGPDIFQKHTGGGIWGLGGGVPVNPLRRTFFPGGSGFDGLSGGVPVNPLRRTFFPGGSGFDDLGQAGGVKPQPVFSLEAAAPLSPSSPVRARAVVARPRPVSKGSAGTKYSARTVFGLGQAGGPRVWMHPRDISSLGQQPAATSDLLGIALGALVGAFVGGIVGSIAAGIGSSVSPLKVKLR